MRTSSSPSSSTTTICSSSQQVNPEKSPRSVCQERATQWQLVTDQALITDAVLHHVYKGAGTLRDPYVVEYIPNDPRDPMNFTTTRKWIIVFGVSLSTLAVSFASSAFTGGIPQMLDEFRVSRTVITLGVSRTGAHKIKPVCQTHSIR